MSSKRKDRILIVDHNFASSQILAKRLEAFGLETDTVATTRGAIDYLNELEIPPDAILVDLATEDRSVLDFPRQVSQETKWQRFIPIAAHTAISNKEFILEAVHSGYVDYIVRPMEAEIFRDRITKLVAKIPELNSTTYRKHVSEIATAKLEAHIFQINEFGMMAICDWAMAANSIVHLESPFLDKLDLSAEPVRVITCTPLPGGEFELQFSFIGLDARQFRQVRRYVMYSLPTEKEKKSS